MTLTRMALTALLLTAGLSLRAADDSAALLERLAAANSTTTVVTGQLTQRTTRADDAGAEPRVLKAVFAVQFPNRYDLVFTRPDDDEWRQRLCCDGERRWVVEQSMAGTPPDRSVTRVDDNDVELKRLFACLRMDVATLSKDYDLKAENTAGIRVTLAPKAPKDREQAVQPERLIAEFNGNHRLKRLVLTDAQGNRHEITVDQAEYGRSVTPDRFRGPDGP